MTDNEKIVVFLEQRPEEVPEDPPYKQRPVAAYVNNSYEQRPPKHDLPADPLKVPILTEEWTALCGFEKTEERKAVSGDDIAGLVFTDRLRILNAIAVAQASIYFRAVKACDSFRRWFEKYNVYPQSRNQLKEASRLQPGITRKKETGTFELRWYRRKFSFNAEKEDGEFGDVKGRYYYFVRTPVGRMRVRVSMEYLKRGTELRYPPSTFRNEPEWAVQAELDLENTFACLRNEQKRLSLIRAQLGYMKADQKKYFEAAFGKEVEAAFEELLQSEKDRLYRYDFSNDAVNYGKPWGIE